MTDIIYPTPGTPLSCADFTSNLTALLERANHTGTQDADTLTNLDLAIENLSIWTDVQDQLTLLTTNYTNLNDDLFANGSLATLISDLENQINNYLATFSSALAGEQIFSDLQNLANNNQSDIATIIVDQQTQDSNINDVTTMATDNETDLNNILNTLIPDLQTLIDTINNNYPVPPTVTGNALSEEQHLVNTINGVFWEDSHFIDNKSYTVPGDFPTINAAIAHFKDKVLNNITVNLGAGVFTENVDFKEFSSLFGDLNIVGAGISNTTIKGSIEVNTINSRVNFSDFTLQGDTIPATYGLIFGDKVNSIIRNLVIEDYPIGIAFSVGSRGNVGDILVRNCTKDGLRAQQGSVVSVFNSEFHNCLSGIKYTSSATGSLNNLNIHDNYIGLGCLQSASVTAQNLSIHDNTDAGIRNNGSLELQDSVLEDNAGDGIAVGGGGQTNLDNVISRDNDEFGFNANISGSITCVNCTASNNGSSGYHATNNSYILASSCIAINNGDYGFATYINSIIYADNTDAISSGNGISNYNAPIADTMDGTGSFIFFS